MKVEMLTKDADRNVCKKNQVDMFTAVRADTYMFTQKMQMHVSTKDADREIKVTRDNTNVIVKRHKCRCLKPKDADA